MRVSYFSDTEENGDRVPATPVQDPAAAAAEQRQRAMTSAAVLSGRARADVAKARGQPPKDPKILRKMQQKELDQRVAESKAMERLLDMRTKKEEAQVQLLQQQKRHEEESHKQRLAHEDELHMARLVDMGVDLDDLRRRPPGFDAATQTETE